MINLRLGCFAAALLLLLNRPISPANAVPKFKVCQLGSACGGICDISVTSFFIAQLRDVLIIKINEAVLFTSLLFY